MKKKALWFVFVLLLAIQIPTFVQGEELKADEDTLQMEELTIQVLPEYAYHFDDEARDKLPILVGYHGSLKNITTTPYKNKIEIPLPLEADDFRISYVAGYNPDYTERNEVTYEIDEGKGVISWEPREAIQPDEHYKFVIEYFTSGITTAGDTKELSYTIKKFRDIGMLNVLIVEPMRAENIEITPAVGTHQRNPYGMNMFHYQLKDLEIGEEKIFHIKYERKEQRMTADIFDQIHEDMAGEKPNETMSKSLIIAINIGVSIAAAALLLFYLMSRNKKAKPEKRGKIKAEKSKAEVERDLKVMRLRAMLVEGEITEEEYELMLEKLGGKQDGKK